MNTRAVFSPSKGKLSSWAPAQHWEGTTPQCTPKTWGSGPQALPSPGCLPEERAPKPSPLWLSAPPKPPLRAQGGDFNSQRNLRPHNHPCSCSQGQPRAPHLQQHSPNLTSNNTSEAPGAPTLPAPRNGITEPRLAPSYCAQAPENRE